MKWWCALLMLVISMSAGSAADSCFEIYRNTTSGAAGALLLNKCTGQSWILLVPPQGEGARWLPLVGSPGDAPPRSR
jgi:hypothetical protein